MTDELRTDPKEREPDIENIVIKLENLSLEPEIGPSVAYVRLLELS